MQSYKISVSKNGKKYTIVFKAENETIARERVHKEGYYILSIEEVKTKDVIGNVFLFTAYNNVGELKHGKIVGDDIFKIYVKLRKNLEYNVISLFSEADKDLIQEEKDKIIKNLTDEYNIYYLSIKKEEKSNKIKQTTFIEKKEDKEKEKDNFYMKKELDEIYKLIDLVLLKLQNLLSGESKIDLDAEQKEKLKNVFNSILKFKKSTNISKLKEIGELALIKIGKIELDDVEKKHKDNSKMLLKQTNLLLKKIGSKESFIEKNKDIAYIVKTFVHNIKSFLFFKNKDDELEKIDKHSHSYIKNKLFLKKYKEKLRENNIYIIKHLISFIFSSEKRLDMLIRRTVIKQNITLFEAKEKGIGFSYTSIKKGFGKITNYISDFFEILSSYLFSVIFIYTIFFILYINIVYYYNIGNSNYDGMFYFLVIFLLYLLLHLSKNIVLIILNFVILFFIIIFGVVNF